MKFKSIQSIIYSFFLLYLVGSCNEPTKETIEQEAIIEIIKIDEINEKDLYPLFAGNLPNGPIDQYMGYQEGTKDYINFFTSSGIALERLIKAKRTADTNSISESLEILNNIENTFDNYGYFPRPPYRDFEYGWVSSMDAPLICLTSLVAYELTENEKYFKFHEKLIPYILKQNNDHGFLLEQEDGSLFPLEYCDTATNDSDAFYVLNGSLVGYLSLSIIERTYPNKEISALIRKIDDAYKMKFNEYIREDSLWSYYMLNPITTNPGHYHIFETKL